MIMDVAFILLIYGGVCVCWRVCVYHFLGDVWEGVGRVSSGHSLLNHELLGFF